MKNNPSQKNKYVEQIVEQAIENSDKSEEIYGIVINLTKEQIEQVEHISSALGIAFGVILNSAVKYAIYYANRLEIPVNQLDTYPQKLGTDTLKEKITAQTRFKLEKAGMQSYLSECIVAGVQLLYGNLINNFATSVEKPVESFVKQIENKTPSEKRDFGEKYVENIGLKAKGKTSGNSSIINAIGFVDGKKIVFQSNLAKTALGKKQITTLGKKFESAEVAIILAIKYTSVFEQQLREQINNNVKLHVLTLDDCINNSVTFQKAVIDLPKLVKFEDCL